MQNAFQNARRLIMELVMRLVESIKRLTTSIKKAFSEAPRMVRAVVQSVKPAQALSFTIFRLAPLVLFMLIVATQAYSQTTGDIDISTPAALFGNIEALYGVLVIVGGYLTAFIPGLNKINDGTLRVLAWAVITAVGFLMFDSGSVLSLSVTYAISTSLYEVILQWFRKSPKPGEGTGEETAQA